MNSTFFQRNEFPLDRGNSKSCESCSKAFSLFLREHQCKRCYKAVCSDCGNFQMVVFKLGYLRRQHRVCRECKDASEYITRFIASNNLRFAQLSETG